MTFVARELHFRPLKNVNHVVISGKSATIDVKIEIYWPVGLFIYGLTSKQWREKLSAWKPQTGGGGGGGAGMQLDNATRMALLLSINPQDWIDLHFRTQAESLSFR